MSVALGLATLGVQCTSNRAVAMATLGLFCSLEVYTEAPTDTTLHLVTSATVHNLILIAQDTNTVRFDTGYDKFGYNIIS